MRCALAAGHSPLFHSLNPFVALLKWSEEKKEFEFRWFILRCENSCLNQSSNTASWKWWNWPRICRAAYMCGFRFDDPKNITTRNLQEKIIFFTLSQKQKKKKNTRENNLTYDDELLKISKFIILWSPKWCDESDSSLLFFFFGFVHSSPQRTHIIFDLFFFFLPVFFFISHFSSRLSILRSRCLVAQKYIGSLYISVLYTPAKLFLVNTGLENTIHGIGKYLSLPHRRRRTLPSLC